MFTGLIEEIGEIRNIKKGTKSLILSIEASKVLEKTKLGDSIAVNGVCLTVTEFGSDYFCTDVMPKTFELSNLKYLKSGSKVNLERAMMLGERLGGHIVSGHVDGLGKIISKKAIENAEVIEIEIQKEKDKYTIEQGSIAIDGTSLTIAVKKNGKISVSLIPTTRKETILSDKKIGEYVNLEFDVIGKYVENMLGANMKSEFKFSQEYLMQNGF